MSEKERESARESEKERVALGAARRFSFRPLFATQFRSLLWLLFFRSSTASPAVYMCRDRQPYWHLCTDTLLRFVAVQQAVQYTVRCRFSRTCKSRAEIYSCLFTFSFYLVICTSTLSFPLVNVYEPRSIIYVESWALCASMEIVIDKSVAKDYKSEKRAI